MDDQEIAAQAAKAGQQYLSDYFQVLDDLEKKNTIFNAFVRGFTAGAKLLTDQKDKKECSESTPDTTRDGVEP